MTRRQANKSYRRAKHLRLMACPSGKKAFKTKFDAELFLYREEAAVHTMEINHEHWRKMPIRSYLCPYCRNYHVTSMPLERFEELRRRKSNREQLSR